MTEGKTAANTAKTRSTMAPFCPENGSIRDEQRLPDHQYTGSMPKKRSFPRRSTLAILAFMACFLVVSKRLKPQDVVLTTAATHAVKPTSCVTIVGDTMIQNGSKDYAAALSSPRDAFGHVEILLQKCPFVVANLEGPITTIPADSDDRPAYSFNMHPSSLEIFKQVGITHFGRGNNHLRDRGEDGVVGTNTHLNQAKFPHFGSGITKQQAAKPAIIGMNGFEIGITAFSDQGKVIAGESPKNYTGVLPVTEQHAALGQELLDAFPNVKTRIAYVHWGKNYGSINDKMRDHAKILAQHGYDLIVGSDGSHSVQEFDYAKGTPVLYNVGNFVFQTPGRYRGMKEYMPFGSVLNVYFDNNGKPSSLVLTCTFIDNKEIEYKPQLCSTKQAKKLFKSLGKHVKHTEGTIYATVALSREER